MANYDLLKTRTLDVGGFSTTQLKAPWLSIVRRSWLMIVMVTFVLFVASLFSGVDQLGRVCRDGYCHPLQLSIEEAQLHQQSGFSLQFYAFYTTMTFAIFGGVCFFVGGLIFRYRSDNWMGLYISLVLIMVGVGAIPTILSLELYITQLHYFNRLTLLFGVWSLPIVLYIFPDGNFAPGGLRWLLGVWMIYNVVSFINDPLPATGIMSGPPSIFTQLVFLIGGLSQIYRYRRSTNNDQKQQTKWAIFGFVGHTTCLILLIQVLTFFPVLSQPGMESMIYKRYAFAFVGLLPILFIPMSLAICILRYRLWNIDVIINRTLVYTLLTSLIIFLYIAIVGGLGALFHTDSNTMLPLIATGIVAVSFHSIREQIQRAINRLMFGHRHEPYLVLENLSKQLEPVIAVEEILPTIVRTIAQALRLPYVALEYEGTHKIVASYPAEDHVNTIEITSLPLIYQSQKIGELRLAPRGRGDVLSPSDLKLLETIARQASIAVYNVGLTADLQRSREKLVTTREEERRRLRRDLHDGLGPVLATMSFQLDAVHNLIESDADQARAITSELKQQVQSSLSEIRRIAYNLRPPTLDELGLEGALREHFTSLESAGELQISFHASLPPTLTAATEVALYRIAMEAVTNVSRHSNATQCEVNLYVREQLYLEVVDNGDGIPENKRTGVGLSAMNERASELGGRCIIENNGSGGTRVMAILPLIQAD